MSRVVHVVGSGPNGLAAAVLLQQAGVSVELHERMEECGGGMRTEPLTLPGYLHDACSAVHPLAIASPFFAELRLPIDWIHPEVVLAHPFDDGSAAVLRRDLHETALALGAGDGARYQRLLRPLVEGWPLLVGDVLAPPRLPRHPVLFTRFARSAVLPASLLLRRFRSERTRALLAGVAAHGTLPLERSPSGAFALVLAAAAHAGGWPIVRGGSQRIADALVARFVEAGGRVHLRSDVTSLHGLHGPVLLDTSPAALLRLAGTELNARSRRALERYRYGPGVHKVEWALRSPVPWRAAECARAGTLHLGGTMAEIAHALREAAHGRVPERPFVLFGQPTQFDPTRAPAGGHIAWAYCAVPFGCEVDCTPLLEAQVERFAPGFRDCIITRSVRTAAELEAYSPNLVGGSIGGGVHTLRQFFLGPLPGTSPYRVRRGRLYLCSAATPPGPGVHGMCGYHAARTLLGDLDH